MPYLTASDEFERANSADLGTQWDTLTGSTALNVSSRTAVPSALGSDGCESYNAVSSPDNQWAQCRASISSSGGGAASNGNGIGVALRCSLTATTCYLGVAFLDGVSICTMIGGAFTVLAFTNFTWTNGDWIRMEVIGNRLELFSMAVSTGLLRSRISLTNNSIASGRFGLYYSSDLGVTAASADDWSAGDMGYIDQQRSPLVGVARRRFG